MLLSSSPSTAAVLGILCVTKVGKGVTRNPAVETAVACDIYRQLIDTNAFSWTLRSIDTYWKSIKFLILLGKSGIFWDNIKYTKRARNKSLFK